METKLVNLTQVKVNKHNPRTITQKKMDLLVLSILSFPKMLELRPIVVDEKMDSLGGNMRYQALVKISAMSVEKIKALLETSKDFNQKKGDERKRLIKYWEQWKKNPTVAIADASSLSDEEKKQFIITDNASFGDWDWDMLANEWDMELLDLWGVDIPVMTETEKLSKMEYSGVYYEPLEVPDLKLMDCVNLEKFNAKVAALDEYDLTEEQKQQLKIFTYRFIKIDFESVANYYTFKATDEEKKAIERLRLVLTDTGINGFIEDDLLRTTERVTLDEKEDEE